MRQHDGVCLTTVTSRSGVKGRMSAVEQVEIMPARERPLPRTLRPTKQNTRRRQPMLQATILAIVLIIFGFLKEELYICCTIVCDALRDKRLRFGIENLYRVFLRQKRYSVFLYRCARTIEPALWPESIIRAMKHTIVTINGRGGHSG